MYYVVPHFERSEFDYVTGDDFANKPHNVSGTIYFKATYAAVARTRSMGHG